MSIAFEWEAAKAAGNVRKHRVSFEEAASVFSDPLSLTISDPIHSEREHRLILLGRSNIDRLIVVAHVERGDSIRLISARTASRKERKTYEEAA